MSMNYGDLNRHGKGNLARAGQEGIVFALRQGTDIMGDMGAKVKKVRAGNTNMFKSDLFGNIFSNVMGVDVELMETDGSQGAARGAGIGTGVYRNRGEAFVGLDPVRTISPDAKLQKNYGDLYPRWVETLQKNLR
jgi:xylulokinase